MLSLLFALLAGVAPDRLDVGYRSTHVEDRSRVYVREDGTSGPRALHVELWYPAQSRGGAPMTRAAYAIAAEEDERPRTFDAAGTKAAVDRFIATKPFGELDGDGVRRILDIPARARRKAPPAKGRFPLIVYPHVDSLRRSVLAEELSSRGFVVASVPMLGVNARALDVSLAGILAQARDVEFVIGHLASDPSVDATRVGLVGMSFGAMSSLAAAMHRSDVGALVSLDGGIGSTPNVEGFGFERAPDYDVARIRVPILHLYGADVPGTELGYLRKLRYSDRFLAGFAKLSHGDFAGDAWLRNSDAEAVAKSNAIVDAAARFLDATLRQRLSGDALAKAIDVASVKGAASTEALPALPPPPTRAELAKLALEGAEKVLERVAELRKRDPLPLSNEAWRELANSFLGRGDLKGGLAIAEEQLRDYPDSGRAQIGLAGILLRLEDRERARKHFTLGLSKLAGDRTLETSTRLRLEDIARTRLRELGASPEEAVRAAMEAWRRATAAGDVEAALATYTDDYFVITEGGERLDRAAAASLMRAVPKKWASFEIVDLETRIYGDTALATGLLRGGGTFEGKPYTIEARFTDVLVLRDGVWRIAAHVTNPRSTPR